jgi:hypothetical protein
VRVLLHVATLIRPVRIFKTVKHKKDLRERAKRSQSAKLDTPSPRWLLSKVSLIQSKKPA